MITWHYIHHMPWTVSLSTTADTGAFPCRMAASTTNFTVHFSLPGALVFVNRRASEVATSSFWADLAPSLNIRGWVWRLIVHKHIFQSVYHPTYALYDTPFMIHINSCMFRHRDATRREPLLQSYISQHAILGFDPCYISD